MITGIQASSSTLPQTELIGELTGKKSKIPIYASDFKREYQYIRGINRAIAFMSDIMEKEVLDTYEKLMVIL